ncbi:unnamed protein product, partial [Pylaiella littoralis]
MSSGRTSGALPSRTTLEAPRGAEGIRRRLVAGRGGASIEQDDSEVVAVNRDNRSDLDEHASRRVCKRREFWKGDEPYATAVDAHDERSLGGIHHRVHQASDIAAAGERDGAGAAGEAPVPTQDDAIGSSLHHRPFSRERGPGTGQQIPSFPRDGIVEGSKASVLPEDGGELSPGTPEVGKPNDLQFAPELEYDPWEGYQIVAEADPVTSWEILREARLSYYTFKYDRRKGRRQLGVLPTEMAKLLPGAFSTFTLPVVLPNGSRSRVEGVPNIDWAHLFAHAVVVTQARFSASRYEALDLKMDVLKAETQNASLKLVRYMEEQGKEWQPAASLRELAALSELKRDIIKDKIVFGKAAGREHRRWLEQKHSQTLAMAEMELDLAITIAEEKASLAVQGLRDEAAGMEKLGPLEESVRTSTEVAILLLDMEAATQTARLSSDRRLSGSLAMLRATKGAEREGEATDVARIRANGAEARKQTQAVVDETCALVEALVVSVVSDPAKLAKIMAALLGIAFIGLLVGNFVTLAARALRLRVTKPCLVRETDLPGSPPAAAAAWVARRGRVLLLPLVGKSGGCTGLNPMSPEALEGIILPPHVEQRLRVIATSIRSSYSRGAPLPHVLIHGAPGSGKSVLARRLAKMCGLNTVVVAGGDVGCLGRSASSELSGLVRWAGGGGCDGGGAGGAGGPGRPALGRSRGRGIVVVMDEAEAALGDRRNRGMSENARSALNAVLLCTGELRPGFLMVLTTSRPQDLDEAMLDRVDEVVELPRPGLAERARLIRQYCSIYLHHDPPADFLHAPVAAVVARHRRVASPSGQQITPTTTTINDSNNNSADNCTGNCNNLDGDNRGHDRDAPRLMAMLAVRSEGFYGRDMAHFFSAVQAAVFGSENCELSEGLWARTERQKLKEFSEKVSIIATPGESAAPATTTA